MHLWYVHILHVIGDFYLDWCYMHLWYMHILHVCVL